MRVQGMINVSLANQTVLSFYLIIKAHRHDTQKCKSGFIALSQTVTTRLKLV